MTPRWRGMFQLGVAGLVGAHLVGYLLCLTLPRVGVGLLALHPGPTLIFRPWQLVTYPFASDAWGMIWSILMLVFLGIAVEREWKTGPFLLLWVLATVGCGVVWALFGGVGVVTGGRGGSLALLLVWGHLHRNLRLALPPIRAQTLVWLILALFGLMALSQPRQLIPLCGAAIGWLYLRVLQRRDDRQATPTSGDAPSRKGFVDID